MSNHLQVLGQAFTASAGRYAALRERITAELRFADELCALHRDRAADWRGRLERAAAAVIAAAPSGSATELEKAVREAEAELAILGPAAKDFTIYCVGHGHIDMNWMWSWPETVAVTNDTFTTVLRLMEEFPGFVYSQSQASVYAIAERHNPELLDRIRSRVKDGRWEVTASHWVENEKNIVSAESSCRHVLYTRAYMQDLFGLRPEDVPIDWSPDTFGHPHTGPTYLARAGVRYYYHHRPGAHGPDKRHQAFWWQGPDGSRVLARNDMALGYNGRISPDIVWTSLLPFHRETDLRFVMFVYGVGDHGGGPTRRDLRRAVDMASWPIFPTIQLSRAQTFYERLEKEGKKLPVLDCELNFEFTGCYTTQTLIKKGHRYSEKKLQDAEAASVLAAGAAGLPYPREALVEAWRDTLFNHFHDILPGSGVMDTRTYAHGLYQKTMATTSQLETQALRKVAALVDTRWARSEDTLPAPRDEPESMGGGAGRASDNGGLSQVEYRGGTDHRVLFLFNPVPVDRHEVVETTIWDPAGEHFTVLRDGTETAAQVLERGAYWGHTFARIAFPASLPGLGYGVWTVRESGSPGEAHGLARQTGLMHPCHYAAYERGPEGLENEHIRVEIDTTTGGIRRLEDRKRGALLLGTSGRAPAVLRYALERSRPMSAWTIEHAGPDEEPRLVELKRAASGPHVATITSAYRIHESDMTVTYEIRDGDPALYVGVAGTWFERGGKTLGTPSLRLCLPVAIAQPVTTYEIPFGAQDRDMRHGEEVPALRWAAVHGKAGSRTAGLLVANDCKHGHSFSNGELSVTLIRSSFDPDPLPEIGKHEARFALVPFAGKLDTRAAIDRARRLDHEIRVISTDAHEGKLGPTGQMAAFRGSAVVLSALKLAEDGDGLVLRFYNTGGKAEDVSVRLDRALVGSVVEVLETDLMERPAPGNGARKTAEGVAARVPAHGITSLRVRVTGPAGAGATR